MADRYIQVKSFSKGLDGRRSDLLEEPGTLTVCQNAHINAGGEVEQRLTFAKDATVFPATTFGFEATASGLVVFGSIAAPGALPTGVSYRRCVPTGVYGTGGFVAVMTGVLSSCNYNGQAFVVATYDDGNTYCFLGDVTLMPMVGQVKRYGSVVYIVSGLELSPDLSNDLALILNSIPGFTANLNTDENGQLVLGTTMLKTDPGLHVGFVPAVTTATSGALSAKLVDQNNPGQINQSATATFHITGGGGGSIDPQAPYNSNGTGVATLTGGPVAWAGTASATASAVVSQVNAHTGTTGYIASLNVNDNSQIIVSAPKTWGALPNGFNLALTLVTITVAATTTPLAITVSPQSVMIFNSNSRPSVVQVVTNVVGYSGTLSFKWTLVSGSSSITFTDGNSSSLVSAQFSAGQTAVLQVEVTDAATSAKAHVQFNVTTTTHNTL